MAGSFSRLKGLDAFPKIQDDFYSKTMSGGIITLISAVVMAFLFATEFGMPPATKCSLRSQFKSLCIWRLFYRMLYRPRLTTQCAFAGAYLSAHKSHQLSVDTSRGETITVSVRFYHRCVPVLVVRTSTGSLRALGKTCVYRSPARADCRSHQQRATVQGDATRCL